MKGVQRYRCWACGRQFLGGNRIDSAELWREYSELKQTYAQLAERYGCSSRTIKRKLDAYTPPKGVVSPGRVIVIMDTTYWGRKYGVMLFKDELTDRDLLWYFVKNETNALYAEGIAELESQGYEVPAVVCDGRKGLSKMFPGKKVQLVPVPPAEDCSQIHHKASQDRGGRGIQTDSGYADRDGQGVFRGDVLGLV